MFRLPFFDIWQRFDFVNKFIHVRIRFQGNFQKMLDHPKNIVDEKIGPSDLITHNKTMFVLRQTLFKDL